MKALRILPQEERREFPQYYLEYEVNKIFDLHRVDSEYRYAQFEVCRSTHYGHYACTTAMNREFRNLLTKRNPSFANPIKAAEWIVEKIRDNEMNEIFSSISIEKPGYINITFTREYLYTAMRATLKKKSQYGKNDTQKKERIIIEFVSANPTGPLNIVSARAAAIGDSLTHMLRNIGHHVTKEFYVNDHGNQIRLLGLSLLLRRLEKKGCLLKFAINEKFDDKPGIEFPRQGYQGDYLIKALPKIEQEHRDFFSRLDDPQITKYIEESAVTSIPSEKIFLAESCDQVGKIVADSFIREQKEDLKKFRVEFDHFFFEQTLYEKNKIFPILDQLEHLIKKVGKKVFFMSSHGGDDKDRVLVREDGRPTYFFSDLAYHYDKAQRNYTTMIDLLGPDHHGYVARITLGLKALKYPGELITLIVQQVNLMKEQQIVKMSKRSGKFVTLAELQKKIPIDVLRYFFIDRSANAHMDFDYSKACITSDKNPYYYIAYAHARICSILRKSKEMEKVKSLDLDHYQNKERMALLFQILRYPEELYEATIHLEPHRFLRYLYQLATVFAQFYSRSENRILEKEAGERYLLLQLIQAVAICLRNGLALLGMKAPRKL